MSWLALGLAVASCGARSASLTADAGAEAAAPDGSAFEVDGSRPEGVDPGIVPIHRLNNLEYDNTVRDLLGVEAHADQTFIPDERAEFDNNAAAFTWREGRYEEYFVAAQSIAQQVFADPALRARVVTCAPTGAQDTDCVARSVRAFGLRAWRRPLTDDEVARLVALHAAETAAGKDFPGAMQTVLTAMLSTVSFLYRIELDPDPASTVPHALGPFDLASRLSYWLWSTTPDGQLLGLASSGELSKPTVLLAQFARLLDDPRSEAFVESFAGQWWGERSLVSHAIEPAAFPEWDEPLRAAMEKEMLLYFSEFLRTDRPFDEVLDADVDFVNARLARHYGMDTAGLGDAFVRVENTGDQRRGLLGLAGFLTATSFSYRADPRLRARQVRSWLLCDPEPSDISIDELHLRLPLDSSPTQPPTFHEQVATLLANPQCGDCHGTFDPIALGLSAFDGIGRFITVDSLKRPLDTAGTLNGQPFKDELEQRIVTPPPPKGCQALPRPTQAIDVGNVPAGYSRNAHVTTMIDLMVMALTCGSTRVISLMLDDAGSGFVYDFLPLRTFTDAGSTLGTAHLAGSYRDLAAGSGPGAADGYATINRWFVAVLAYLVDRLDLSRDYREDGSVTGVLDNTVILLGSGMRDAQSRSPADLPLLLVSGTPGLKRGKLLDLQGTRSLSDVYLTLGRDVFGLTGVQTFADSRGGAPEILA